MYFIILKNITKFCFFSIALSILLFLSLSSEFPVYSQVPTNSTGNQPKISGLDSTKAIALLKSKIQNILAANGLKKTKYGIGVYSLNQRKFLYEKDIDKTFTPASTTKLFTTFTALLAAGANCQIKTQVFTDAIKIDDGIINGNLYIVGHGDALLSTSDIESLAEEVYGKGIRKINGNIYADGSFFDNIKNREKYSGDNEIVEPLPPITALSLEKNHVTVLVHSTSKPINPVAVQTFPASEGFKIINLAKVGGTKKFIKTTLTSQKQLTKSSIVKPSAKSKNTITLPKAKQKAALINKKQTIKSSIKKPSAKNKNIKIQAKTKQKLSIKKASGKKNKKGKRWSSIINNNSDDYLLRAGDAVSEKANANAKIPKSGINIQSKKIDDVSQNLIISGWVFPNRTYSFKHFIDNPEIVVAGALKSRLEAGDIQVNGKIGIKQLPSDDKQNHPLLLAEFSRTLTDLIVPTNKNSDNYLAENIFKFTGAYSGDRQNNAKKSLETRKIFFSKLNIPYEKCQFFDGSGLCRKNLTTPEALIKMLEAAHKQPFFAEFDSSLSIAGVDGTLRKRMTKSPAENNLHAKTGTLRNASALAGYVTTADGELLAFTFIFNGPSVGVYKKTEDEICKLLAGFLYKIK